MNDLEDIGSVLMDMIKDLNLEDRFLQAQIHNIWDEIAGKYFASQTKKLKFENGCLSLYFDSPSIKNEIQYSKTAIIEQINKTLNKEVVKQIKVY